MEQAAASLKQAWSTTLGEPAPKQAVAVLTAQWAHETGRGRSMYNYNFGGIKGAGPSGLTVVQRTKEGCGETERTIKDGFRAYRTPDEGALDYVRLLARRYPAALDAARAGDPVAFVHQLKQGGYFTGNEAEYARSVVGLSVDAATALDYGRMPVRWQECRGLADGETVSPTQERDGLTVARFMAAEEELALAALRICAASDLRGRKTLEPEGTAR